MERRPARNVLIALAFCGAIIALPVLQLVPLPPEIWMRLPGREIVQASLAAAGIRPGWAPLSVAPEATLTSALALLPPLSVFIATLQFGSAERRQLVRLLLTLGATSAFLGLAQVAEGPKSALRFYAITNPTEAVGFFANRNHFSALMYVLLPFAAVWILDRPAPPSGSRISAPSQKEAMATARFLKAVTGVVLFIALLAAQAIARSRSGLSLALIALVGVIGLGPARIGSEASVRRYVFISFAFVLLLSTQYALFRIFERFEHDPLSDARVAFARTTIKAAFGASPYGIGLGGFPPYYGAVELKADFLPGVYANHAHNDFLELWLETGIFGPLLVAIFCVWFSARVWAVWRRRVDRPAGIPSYILARAATLVVLLLLLHSTVDYPLRTSALASLFAFACGLLFEPLKEGAQQSHLNMRQKVVIADQSHD